MWTAFQQPRTSEDTDALYQEELKALLNDLVRKMDTGSLFVYYQVTRGTAVRSHEFR